MQVHPDRALVVQAPEAGCTAPFALAPRDLMDELAVVRSEVDSCASLGVTSAHFPFRLVSRRLDHAGVRPKMSYARGFVER
jgi:hypothetical protein